MMMNVLDTATGTAAVLEAEEGHRENLLRKLWAPATGVFRYFPGDFDIVDLHKMSLGFPIDRDLDICREGLARLRSAGAWERIGQALNEAAGVQASATPGITVPDITFFLLLGDPGDEFFMTAGRGLSGSGAVTGYILLTVWPTQENLERIEAAAVHELNHNLRYAPGGVVWDPAVVTVGEHIVGEGVADAFARQLYGEPLGYTPMGRPHLADDAVFDKVVTGLDVTGMQNFAAWVLGDEAARKFGIEPVGLPAGAGYAAGNRLVDRYLTATGKNAADALHVPGQEIIEVALGRDRAPG